MTDCIDHLARAKTRLVLEQPFFAHIVLSLPMIVENRIGTMATDGQRIYYSEEFVRGLSVSQLAAVLAHEALHVAFLHPLRCGARDPKIWNYAIDAAVNPILKDAKMDLPQPCILVDKYKNMSGDEIYREMIVNVTNVKMTFADPNGQPQDGDGNGDGKGGGEMWGGVISPRKEDGSGLSDSEMSELSAEMEGMVREAAAAAKAIGKLPGGLEGLIEALDKPKVNWRDYIQSWISGVTPDDYSWRRPNRAMLANHSIYMPRMLCTGSGIGVLSIDTSGSVSDAELKDFVQEILGVIEMTKPEKLYIIQHDAVIQRVDIWDPTEDFTGLKIKGRGGTCVAPVFKHVEHKIEEPIDWFIGFSDMEIGDFPSAPPAYPVLWCSSGRGTAPWGAVIPLRDRME